MANLLVEVMVEEMPSSYIEPALRQMKGWAKELFSQNNLTYRDLGTEGTLRRLVLFVEGLPSKSPSRIEKVRGPALSIAFVEGKPTKAALGFARKFGIEPEDLETEEDENGAYCVATVKIEGRPTLSICADIIPQIVLSVRFPKSMRWGKGNVSFARPIRGVLALLDGAVVPTKIAGLSASNTTRGHPFAAPGPITIETADFKCYADALRKAFVVVEFDERKKMLEARLNAAAFSVGANVEEDEILDEVANMVEYPSVGLASFEERYLALPSAVLKAVIKDTMKYFPLRTSSGFLNSFLFVADRPEGSIEKIKEGNERVVNARLEDAKFYFERDRKKSLKEFSEKLGGIIFQESLGSYKDVTSRLVWLVELLVEKLKFREREKRLALEAASLLKADLATQMVAEFPSLQGTIGGEYARLDGYEKEVVDAIAHQYFPIKAGEAFSLSPVTAVVALADRLLSIVGFWAIGAAPTGTKDPFAIRRHSLNIIRILDSSDFDIDVFELFTSAAQQLPDEVRHENIPYEVADFFRERLRGYFCEGGNRSDFVEAVLSVKSLNVKDAKERLDALQRLSKEPLWRRLCETVERTLKISRKETHKGEVLFELLFEEEERKLYERYVNLRPSFEEMVSERKYYEASILFHNALSDAVHDFFDKVFVYVEDEALRRNRILLSLSVYRLYADNIADLSKILFESEK
ncbi:MAG: glycine--tRNA ligase subunit beta [Planctomycetota bacterium]|nr:glycine--tRNA ligase subunit beta [Planctomycetota bacterium]